MAETKNETKPENEAEPKNAKEEKTFKLTLLVFLASLLSVGSLIWTTYSLLDFYQVGGIDLATMSWKDISVVGLSAAATADIAWTVTMVAEFRGSRIMAKVPGTKNEPINILPYIGWAEVLFVAFLLFKHGQTMGNGEAAFAAALPLLTKFSWMAAIDDLKDPSDLTDEMKLQIAETRQQAKLKKERSEATAEEHEAEMEARRRQHEAELEEKRAEAEKLKLEKQTEQELEEMKLRGETSMKLLKQNLHTELQIELLNGQRKIEVMRADFEQDMYLRSPLLSRQTIVGDVVRQGGQRAIEDGLGDMAHHPLAGQDLTRSEMRQAELALRYYIRSAERGGVLTKKEFCEKNDINPPRLSEATKDFPQEWFQVRGLATWTSGQS